MAHLYLLPMIKNMSTGMRVKTQDLTGGRFTASQRALAQSYAENVAREFTARTGDPWEPVLVPYTPSERSQR